MIFETRAARVVQLDAKISLLDSRDPAFVRQRLVPQRAQVWQKFRAQFSASCSSADTWEIVGLITGAPR